MKKIIYILSLFMASVLYTSCDALDLVPEDYSANATFWTKKAQVDSYMAGLHAQLRGDYGNFYLLGEVRGGTQREGTSSQNTSLEYAVVRSNSISKDNPGIKNWGGFYNSIMLVNHLIQKVEGECAFLSEAERNAVLAQAYGLRSYYYFILFKTYGGVPIVTTVELLNGKVTADKFYIPRNTPEETMKFIKEDIGKSEAFYGTAAIVNNYKKPLWSKAATLMLKAEIHMWASKVSIKDFAAKGEADLKIAETALSQLIGKFELLPKYSDIFSTANRNSKEVILTLHFADGEATNWGGTFMYQDAVFINQVYGRDDQKITKDTLLLKGTGGVFRHEYKEEFWKNYKATDSRRDATFLEYYTKDKDGNNPKFGCVMKKGIGSLNSNNARVYDADVILYRYTDALLMMAEVANGLGKPCAEYINEVRKRAYGTAYAANAYTEGDYATNELAILQERDKEFVWENKRWYDVVRMHDANKKSLAFSATANYPSTKALLDQDEAYKLLWPLDVNVMANNTMLTPTPGYE